MDGGKVGVLEERDEVRLGGLLQGHDGGGLETQVGLEILSNLADETLEGQLPDQQLRGLLVATNFTEGDSSGTETVRLLDTTSRSSLTAKSSKRIAMSDLRTMTNAKNMLTGAVFLAALEASCLRGALPPVDLRAVCLVRAIVVGAGG